MNATPAPSLLWPAGAPRTTSRATWQDEAIADLGLSDLARALAFDPRQEDRVKAILLAMVDDAGVIHFRQRVLSDLMDNDALAAGLRDLLPSLNQLSFYGSPGRPNEPALQQTLFRLGELELYVDCVQRLRRLLADQGEGLHADAFIQLRDALAAAEQEPAFQALCAELPDLLDKVRNIGSITIGINLNAHMLPSEATLLSINNHRFKGAGIPLLDKLRNKNDPTQGLARLHRIVLPDGMPATRENMMLVPLFKDLSELLESTARPVADALARYAKLNAQVLIALESEIAFYLGALQWMKRVRDAGLPLCAPAIAPSEARLFEARGLFNINFAMRLMGRAPNTSIADKIVLNDASFNDAGRIFILTGPNQGGKTTFTQAIGLIHVLAQAGLLVPAQSAQLSPVDAIFTHFAKEERPNMEAGRLGEEARRLNSIFQRATRRSLVLLNESLSSTSPDESLYLSIDVVRGLKLLGARAIFATHLHGLAEAIGEINRDSAGDSLVSSLVSVTEQEGEGGRRTYRIIAASPQGLSFARDIARKHGISFEQIEQLLKSRKDAG
jgi:DNA mismatch repair protein MutS